MFRIGCVGSRDINEEQAKFLFKIGYEIVNRGWMINTGNAIGSDYAFARGGNYLNPNAVKLFMPWKRYNLDHLVPGNIVVPEVNDKWLEIAKRNHPEWDRLTPGAVKMMMRNAGIVLESDIVLAFVSRTSTTRGTEHSLNCARDLKKPHLEIQDKTFEEVSGFMDRIIA